MVCRRRIGDLNSIFRGVAGTRPNHDVLGMDRRERLGISPVISSTILIAITVTLGLALWSFVISQANTSTQSFASATTDYVNYVNERYVIVAMALGYDEPNTDECTIDSECVTIWIYNYSERDVRIDKVFFGDSAATQEFQEHFKTRIEGNLLKANALGSVTVDLSGSTIHFTGDGNTVYYATVGTEGGITKVFYQTDK